jgi:threonine dehydrogenase-like Zn-dependent dehydrogenase
VTKVQADLATQDSVKQCWDQILSLGRNIGVACINTGVGGLFAQPCLDAELKRGQTNMHNYMSAGAYRLERIEKNQIDPSYIVSHRITLKQAPEMYKVWRDKQQSVTKFVIDPWAA